MQNEITETELRRRAGISAHWKNPIGIAKRFWTKVDQRGLDECWPWKAWINNKGYGCFSFRGKDRPASRVAYILSFGDIPESLDVCHRCDNPPCCNPAHLFAGTTSQNIQDMVSKGRCGDTSNPGESHPNSVLTNDKVIEMRAKFANGISPKSLGVHYGISTTHAWRIVTRKSWTHII